MNTDMLERELKFITQKLKDIIKMSVCMLFPSVYSCSEPPA